MMQVVIAVISVLLLFRESMSQAAEAGESSLFSHHNKFHKRGEYLKHLLSAGQLYGGKTALGVGLNYDKGVLQNGNVTMDEQMAHCEYFDLHPFTTARPFRQCLRTNYYELISDMIIKTGSYGKGVHEGCNYLLYAWSIFGNAGHHGLFVDAGANIGTCTLLFAANGVPAVAFEPMPPNYKVFAKSIIGNSPAFDDMIMLYPYGLGDEEGSFTAYMQFNNMGNSMLHRAVPIHRHDQMVREQVNVKLMDDLLWANRLSGAPPPTVHLMKLDVQGYEFKALKGAQHLLAAGAISMIAFENENTMLNVQGTSCEEIVNYLHGFNYEVFTIDGKAFPVAADCRAEPFGDLFAKLMPAKKTG